ncbi:ribonuclease H [Microbacterium sp.]|uniref:ribonuclease H family protein n=1 Tax=Microbacterium sp. TaxID=51671 RepID=UPI0026014EA4|nr:ribonuclease H [Microbacterium sp.]
MPERRGTSANRRRIIDSYTVATDGACSGNPGPTGWAWVGEDGQWAAGALPEGTNNIGELLGLLNAIRDHRSVRDLTVQADSRYAIDTYTKWMDGHARRGWKTAGGSPAKNVDLLKELIAERDGRRQHGLPDVVLEHVRGHAGHRLNSWADERAVRAAAHAAKGTARSWSSLDGQDPIDVSIDPPRSAQDKPRSR